MSEDDYEDIEKVKKSTKIKINVDENAIADRLHELQQEDKDTTEYEALMVFDTLKSEVAEASGDSNVLNIETPEELQTYLKTHMKQHRNPSGKSTNSTYNRDGDSKRFDNPRSLMDSIYSRAYNRGIPVKTEDGLKARQQINELFTAWLSGKSWSQMKYKIRDRKHPFPESDVELLTCSKCHRTIEGYPCEYCGYNPKMRKVF